MTVSFQSRVSGKMMTSTTSYTQKNQLKVSTGGKIVGRKRSDQTKVSKQGQQVAAWGRALKQAREELGIKGWKVGRVVSIGILYRRS